MQPRPVLCHLAVLVMVLCVATGAVRPPTAGAQPDAAAVTLGPLVAQTVWAPSGGAVDFEIALTTPVPPAQPSVVVRFGDVVDRDELLAGLADGTLERPVSRTVPSPTIEGGVLRVSLAAADDTTGVPRVPRLDEGVHPVVVELREAGRPVAQLRTHVVVVPGAEDRRTPLGLAVVLEREALPAILPDGSLVPDGAATAWLAAATAYLSISERAGQAPPDLLVTPELVEALATAGDEQQVAGVAALVGAVTASGAGVVLGPWVPVDEALWIATGAPDLVASLRQRGVGALTDSGLAPTVDDVALLDPTAGEDTIDGLVALGVDRFLVEPGALSSATSVAAGRRLRIGAGTGFVVERGVLERLTGPDPTLAAVNAAAELAAIWFEEPERGRGVVLAPDEALLVDGRALRTLAAVVETSPVLEHVPLTTLYTRVPTAVEDTAVLVDEPSVPVPDIAERRNDLLARVGSYEAFLGGAQPLSQNLRDRLDAATAAELTGETRAAYLDAVDLAVQRGTQGITVPPGQAFTLTSRSADLQLRIDNPLGHNAHVLVRLESDTRLELPEGAERPVVLAPGENVIDFAVRARSTGASQVDVTLRTPDGAILLAEGQVRVRSTALTGVALVLGGGAIIVLLVWWARQIAAKRRPRPDA